MRLLETALYVADLERSVEFYQRVFGFAALDSEGSRMRALAVAQTPAGGRQRLAFAIDAGEREPWERRLRELGVPLESKVTWPRGGTSLYFRDPDGHSLELVTPGCWPVY